MPGARGLDAGVSAVCRAVTRLASATSCSIARFEREYENQPRARTQISMAQKMRMNSFTPTEWNMDRSNFIADVTLPVVGS
ncbi:hypothetical protein [Thermobacillus sp. ZCTH02-B1]|uniref:hypothetical protein n=1 Tax=Thermobacillus sp. ZCTH02-B1 TaxID=1858795 RepID=UPI00345D9632